MNYGQTLDLQRLRRAKEERDLTPEEKTALDALEALDAQRARRSAAASKAAETRAKNRARQEHQEAVAVMAQMPKADLAIGRIEALASLLYFEMASPLYVARGVLHSQMQSYLEGNPHEPEGEDFDSEEHMDAYDLWRRHTLAKLVIEQAQIVLDAPLRDETPHLAVVS